MPVLSSFLTLGNRWTFVAGKGGVGKTTVAAALAIELADAGEPVLVLSFDPAHSLGDALGVVLGSEPVPISGVPGLRALEVDAEAERARFLAEHGATIAALIERGTYLDRSDVDGLLGLSLPGVDELAALLTLVRLADASRRAERVVIDTAPTGHTLRLLELPQTGRGWMDALDAMDAKHRAVAEAFAGAGAARIDDAATEFLRSLEADFSRVSSLLSDPTHTRFVLVTTPEPVVLAESRRYREALDRRKVPLGGVVVNRAGAGIAQVGSQTDGTPVSQPFGDLPITYVPHLSTDPQGLESLRRFGEAAAPSAPHPPAPPPPSLSSGGAGEQVGGGEVWSLGEPYTPPSGRRLYLIGGKGGVGKTTIASALAVRLAEERDEVLLLSTDPAGSLGEVFDVEVGADPVAAPGVASLRLRQVDAPAAWEAFRAEARAEAEQWFDNLLGPGLSAQADRQVVERLIDLVPPGVDELMALLGIVDVHDAPSYNALVLDTAPTGHLLRLLETPRLGLDWAHALLRLLLKYRHVGGVGGLAERLLVVSRSLRALRARLEDRAHTMILVVALPEALSVPETERLIPRLEALGLAVEVLVVNRLFTPDGVVAPGREEDAVRLLRAARDLHAAGAPCWERGPEGAGELRRFARSWRRIGIASSFTP